MPKKIIIKFAVSLLALLLMTEGAFASGGVTLKIDGRQANEPVKVIDGKQYISVDSLSKNLGGVTISKGNNSIDISSDSNKVTDIISKISPSVVAIIGKLKESSSQYSDEADNLVFGTGVIYRSNGYIITNAHVVKDIDTIVVVLSNSKAYKARLKAIDEALDLAVIKIDKGGLQPAVFGDTSSIVVGQDVVAIGTPLSFSYRNSATKGIISGINRSTDGEYRFIQSDAAINGGNSGGPLVNMKGQVIGINSVKLSGYGVEGLNFSIPADTVKYAISHFEKFGRIKRAYLGTDFSDTITSKYGLPNTTEGLIVKDIDSGSPAERYDIRIDDTLLSINGKEINSVVDYNEEMKKYLPGDKAVFVLLRDKKSFKVNVVFGEMQN
jgi:serine protease Do